MNERDLIEELLQSLDKELKTIGAKVERIPTQSPPDYRASIESLTQVVETLRQRSPKPVTASVDLSPITAEFEQIRREIRQRPEYKMSQYVQYGAYAFGLMVVLLVASVWFGLSWKGERDKYQQAYYHDNWRVRYTEQANPEYYAYMEGVFSKEPSKVYQWVEEQEQADQKRALAREAAEQAKALSDQANRLEGKTETKGKKKAKN